uniref:Uncharacterized protein n=1 Tax=Triticum urartu TaxID=4572 RepID=A0A8R7QNI7_TRIUA
MLNYLSVKIYISFGGISEEQSYHNDAHAEQARLSKCFKGKRLDSIWSVAGRSRQQRQYTEGGAAESPDLPVCLIDAAYCSISLHPASLN